MSLRTEKRFIGGRLVPKSHANPGVTFLLPLPEPGIAKLRQAPARRLSISLGVDFCIETIGEALRTEKGSSRDNVFSRAGKAQISAAFKEAKGSRTFLAQAQES